MKNSCTVIKKQESKFSPCGAAQNEETFLKQLGSIMQGVYSCNFQEYCYTQLCDVQQEVNGLLTAERKPKADIEKLKALFSK